MATSSGGDGSGDQRRLLSIPKEGERIIAPTRRPDGTLRKAIRIRAGYVPQEEVAIYQSKGALVSPRPRSFLPCTIKYRISVRFRCFLIAVAACLVLGADEEIGPRRAAGVRPSACCRCQAQDEGGQAERAAQGETAAGRASYPMLLVEWHSCGGTIGVD